MNGYDEGTIAGLVTLLSGFIFFILIILIAYIVFYLIGAFKMYKKAGKGGWECLIPFYSTYVLVEIAGLNWWWFLIASCGSLIGYFTNSAAISGLASLASLFGMANIYYNLAKKFNKSTGWFVLSIFFGGITLPLLGYSSKEYYDFNKPVSKNGFLDKDNTVQPNNQNNMGQQQYQQPQQPYYGQQQYQQPQQPMYGQQQPYYGQQPTQPTQPQQPQQPTDNNNLNQ